MSALAKLDRISSYQFGDLVINIYSSATGLNSKQFIYIPENTTFDFFVTSYNFF